MMKKALIAIPALALLGAAQPAEWEQKPGEGVLCIGTFLYVAQLQAETCHEGKDPEYQAKLSSYRDRLDAYLIRNFPGGKVDLDLYKEDENLRSSPDARLCDGGDDDDFYGAFKQMDPEALDTLVDKVLERDGPPTIGDCV